MISHLVLFRFKPGIGRNDVRVHAAAQAMAGLPAAIPTIRGWEHGFNITSDVQAWDYGLRAAFDCEVDLHAYFEHPAHLPVLAQWEAIAELSFCDLELS
jgi:hypothetical protein